jgi:tubulin--tyrosine ligase-like protein 12
MAALVCVDLDRRVELEDSGEQDQEKSGSLDDVLQVLEKERTRIQEKGGDSVAWLELEELGIDDDMLVTLDLPAKFPVGFYLMCMFLLANLYIGKGGYVLDIVFSMERK